MTENPASPKNSDTEAVSKDEVKIESTKQTVPVLKGTSPTADDVEEWAIGFSAALAILNLADALEKDHGINSINAKAEDQRTKTENAILLKNNKVYSYLLTATRDTAREIVRDHAATKNAYEAYQEILSTYTRIEKKNVEFHEAEYNKVPKIHPHSDPAETMRLLRKHVRRLTLCKSERKITDKQIMMRFIALRPELDKSKIGTIEYEIARLYDVLRKEIEDAGYASFTMGSFQKKVKEFFDEYICQLS